jgi:AraC-like DNA-binding protein
MFYLTGIIITVFLSVLLLSKKGKTPADAILSAWLCLMGLHLLLFYWQITGEIYGHTYLLGIQVPLPLLHGPFLYMYTRAVCRGEVFKINWLFHFIPAFIVFLLLGNFFLLSADEKIAVYKNHGAGFEIQTSVTLVAGIISGFLYVLLSLIELRKYHRRINEEFSDTERINLNWLLYLISGILVIWLIILLDGDDPVIFGAVVVFVLLLGYFGIKHVGIFTYRQKLGRVDNPKIELTGELPSIAKSVEAVKEQQPATAADSAPVAPSRYAKSSLQKEIADEIHVRLLRFMEEAKVFKQEELSLTLLARKLDVHPNNLSQVINTYEGKSFYDYINSLRIEEFKRLAMQPQNSRYTLLSLAFECGFNSKTSFNRNFKKITGQSPSAFLRELNVELVAD